MRRSLVCGLFCALALSSCVNRGELPPADVLQKAAFESQKLTSASYTFSGTLDTASTATMHIVASATGSLQDGGRQTQLSLKLSGTINRDGIQYVLNGEVEVLVAAPGEVYVRIHQASTVPPYPLLSTDALERLKGQWVRLPTKDAAGASAITPDPELLRVQSQVVKILKDRGIESIDRRDAYHYAVAIDAEKLLAFLQQAAAQKGEKFDEAAGRKFAQGFDATGDLWIDADTFYVHRLSWQLHSRDTNAWSGHFDLILSDHNTAPRISPPPGALSLGSGASLPMPNLLPSN